MRDKRDLEFMLDPSRWPCFPLLPLKRPSKIFGEFPEFATLRTLSITGSSFMITEMSIDHLIDTRGAAEWNEADPAQLVADGWLVD